MITLAVHTTSLIVLMRQIEGATVGQQERHHFFSGLIIFVERFLALLKVLTSFTVFASIEVPPLIANHLCGVIVDRVANSVGSIQVIETHIIFSVIVPLWHGEVCPAPRGGKWSTCATSSRSTARPVACW